MRFASFGSVGGVLALVLGTPGCAQDNAADVSERAVELFDNLGNHHYEIGTRVAAAQDYFDQGLRLYYGFNHGEAVRSFREAQRLDPDCAMCWWGEALAWGPNINLAMDSASGVAAYRAARRALQLAPDADGRERSLIDALSLRYEPIPAENRAHLDSAYSTAMEGLLARYPGDPEVAVLYAESVMDLQPWDYWAADRTLKPGVQRAVDLLNRVLAANPNHPGACHFLIHAVEEERPDLALPCAERLADLMPGAGHLVHMPGHIYIRVGRYGDAVEANRHAVHADETYIRDRSPGLGMYTVGYYPHNYDFMAFAASMIGRGEDAIDAAGRMAGLIPEELIGQPGMSFLEHWMMRPVQFQVRFGRWQDILDRQPPAAELSHARALWHYARGRARVATGDLSGAHEEHALLTAILEDSARTDLHMEFNQSSQLLSVAHRVLGGKIAAASGMFDEAIAELREAVRLESELLYGEPPEWSIPVREELGVVLLQAERWESAEEVFREDLEDFPDNGWSLYGLALALAARSETVESQEVMSRFSSVWSSADFDISSSY